MPKQNRPTKKVAKHGGKPETTDDDAVVEDGEEDNGIEIVSRTALKNELKDRQQKMFDFMAMSENQLKALPLPDDARDAILQAKDMRADSGRRRLLRWAAKRLDDEDYAAVDEKLAEINHASSRATAIEHDCENWRSRLLATDSSASAALTELLNQYPAIDRQNLRQILRSSAREIQQNKPPKYQRELFRLLRTALSE